MAVAVSTTNNPLLLFLALAVVALVVANRRGSSPWARAFRLYLWLGLFIIVVRVVLHVLVGLKFGEIVLFSLPEVTLPSWAAGIQLGGTVYLEGLLGAALLGLRLAVIIACIGAANALANPKRLLRSLPGACTRSARPSSSRCRSRRSSPRASSGCAGPGSCVATRPRGIRSVPSVALPVLQDTLERSLLLAAAMDSRGYGRAGAAPASHRLLTGAVTLIGLLAAALGIYGVLDTTTPALMGTPALLLGLALSPLGLWLGGRHVERSSYRPDPWRGAEWLTLGCGVVAAAVLVSIARTDPRASQCRCRRWRSRRCRSRRWSGCSSARCPPSSHRRRRGPPRACRSVAPAKRSSAHAAAIAFASDVTLPGPTRPVLRDVDLGVEEGELCLVVGPHGLGQVDPSRCRERAGPALHRRHARRARARRSAATPAPTARATWPTWSASWARTRWPASSPTRSRRSWPTAWSSSRLPAATMRKRVEETLDLLGIAELRDVRCATCPAGSSSGSPSARCSPPTRGCSCSTSRPRRSTPPAPRRCSPRSPGSCTTSAVTVVRGRAPGRAGAALRRHRRARVADGEVSLGRCRPT